ncbi:hypothetical protein TNCV_3284841 [Trichonephila clavipes]|nr:hypothetical protein TNCV_3284841 [Trichonephila clavipes]
MPLPSDKDLIAQISVAAERIRFMPRIFQKLLVRSAGVEKLQLHCIACKEIGKKGNFKCRMIEGPRSVETTISKENYESCPVQEKSNSTSNCGES